MKVTQPLEIETISKKKKRSEKNMKLTHANVMMKGQRRMPIKGDTCDMSCQFAFACANMKEGEPCKGFQLLSNGKITRLIKQNLAEYDQEYIQNCIRMIQNGTTPETEEAMVKEVYRYIAPPKQPEGFRGMIEAISRTIEEPDLKVKMTGHTTTPISFLKYRDKTEHIPTNREIQARIKKEKEEKKNV